MLPPISSPSFKSVFLLALTLLFFAPRATSAQAPCATGPISFVFVDNKSIFDTNDPDLDKRFAWAYRLANALHFKTKRQVIERELLFGPGDCYDPYLLEETERLLRGYDFLSQVDVMGVSQPDGSYHVIINTRDQWSTQLDLRVGVDDGLKFESVRVREANLFGTGQEVGFYYLDRDVTRDYGVAYGNRQVLGTRWDLRTGVGRTRAGTFFNEMIGYPFIGEVGRWAARQTYSRDDQFFDYIAVDSTRELSQHVLLPVREKLFDVAVGTRFGRRGNLTLIGATIGYQAVTYPGIAQRTIGNDFDARTPVDSTTAQLVSQQTEQLGSFRVGAVFGQRRIWWTKKRGFDSMRGEQDVPLGADVTVAVASALPGVQDDKDLTGTLKFFGALDGGSALFATRARLDVRHDFQAAAGRSPWEDFYSDVEVLQYWKPAARHTFFMRVAGAGVWNSRTPFQLTLGGERNLRGYRNERFPGGRRLVANLEDRIFIGWPFPGVADVGATLFFDVGRMWPGDVPFGRDSGWRSSAGAGLRSSFPANSRTTFRIDFAMPLDGAPSFNRMRVLLSASELLGLLGSDIPDVQLVRSRNEGPTGELFRFRR